MAVYAQSLTGKQWCSVFADDDGEDIAVALTFETDGTCELLIAAKQEFKQGILEGMPKMDHLKIVKLENKKLVLKNDE